MALTRVIKQEVYDKLADGIKGEYQKQEDGSFVLDLTDYEDPAALKRAKDHERDQAKAARQEAKALKESLDALTAERDGLLSGAIPKADVARLEESYKKKLATRETELTTQINAAQASLQKLLVDNVAQSIAAEISTAPAVIMPHIKARLAAERSETGEFTTRILDKDGKPSAATLDELKKEFRLNKDFSAIITGSKASGGGAGGGSGGGGAASGKGVDWSKSSTLSLKDIAAGLRASGKAPEVTAE